MSDTVAPRALRHLPDGWTIISIALASLLLMPIAAVVWLALFPTENIWPHLLEFSLPLYLGNTLVLMSSVTSGRPSWAPAAPGWW
ncbi:MAG: hypothetical protein AAGD47_14455 [Pseudomonadota bacterium]